MPYDPQEEIQEIDWLIYIFLEEFGPSKVFDQSIKFHKTEHLVLSRMPFCRNNAP